MGVGRVAFNQRGAMTTVCLPTPPARIIDGPKVCLLKFNPQQGSEVVFRVVQMGVDNLLNREPVHVQAMANDVIVLNELISMEQIEQMEPNHFLYVLVTDVYKSWLEKQSKNRVLKDMLNTLNLLTSHAEKMSEETQICLKRSEESSRLTQICLERSKESSRLTQICLEESREAAIRTEACLERIRLFSLRNQALFDEARMLISQEKERLNRERICRQNLAKEVPSSIISAQTEHAVPSRRTQLATASVMVVLATFFFIALRRVAGI